jgi:hypothetical protein
MNQYHKIQTVFLRDPENRYRTLLDGVYANVEFEYLKDVRWIYTEKVDGTNIRVMFDGDNITFGGKTDRAQLPAPLFAWLQAKFLPRLDSFKHDFANGVCLYGEGCGAKIQKIGASYGPVQKFVLFDVRIGDYWLGMDDVRDIGHALDIEVVPEVGYGTLPRMVEMVKAGFNSAWGDFPAEGIVARPSHGLLNRHGHRIITKIKTKDFAK